MPSKVRVVVVEDMEIVRQGLRALLETCKKYSVCGEAADGLEAIECVGREKPDVVLMDLTMPRMDGVEAIRVIKARHPDVRILVLTAHASDKLVFSALQAGADGYLLKNARAKDLFEAITTVLSGKMYICSVILDQVVQGFLGNVQPMDSRLEVLSQREIQILRMVGTGAGNVDIGTALFISPKTVEKHKSNLKRKLNLTTPLEFVSFCLEQGLISRD